jgi:hypothetical protein
MPADTYEVRQLGDEDHGRIFVTRAHVSALKGFASRNEEDEVDVSEDDNENEEDDVCVIEPANEEEEINEVNDVQADPDVEGENVNVASDGREEESKEERIRKRRPPKYLGDYECEL